MRAKIHTHHLARNSLINQDLSLQDHISKATL